METQTPNPLELSREAFLALTRPAHDGCLEWLGALHSATGYGTLRHPDPLGTKRRFTYSHRVAYMLFKGEIPKGMTVDHICFNRWCVNPDHLQLLTPAQNSARKSKDDDPRHVRIRPTDAPCEVSRRGGVANLSGDHLSGRKQAIRQTIGDRCANGHLLTEETLRIQGRKHRCRTCERERQQKARVLNPRPSRSKPTGIGPLPKGVTWNDGRYRASLYGGKRAIWSKAFPDPETARLARIAMAQELGVAA